MNKNFICATNEYCSFEKYISAPYFRKSFEVDFIPEDAEISICGLGFYVLYINGINITKGMLAPYISNPDHICYYDSYNVKEYLKIGKNVISIMLGNGFNNPFGGRVWGMDRAEWCSAPRVSLDFSATSKERKIHIISDESFKVSASPIFFDELRMGEYYDANKEIDGWNKVEFDDNSWGNAIVSTAPRGDMRLCTAEPIRVTKKLSPKSIIKQEDGYVYDFGENNAGVCTLRISAYSGQKIELWHGEELKDGNFDNTSVIFDRPGTQFYKEYGQKDIFIAKGEGIEEYTPTFTYHGFRYVFVKGITEKQANPELLIYNVMSSDLKNLGGFRCSDEIANTLFEMAERSDISNFYYFPTDCPHREKNGWTGDASMSAAHTVLLYDVEKSWCEWLNNIRLAQTEEGMLPGIVPTYEWGYEWGNGPAWDSVIFNLPYQLYKKRGNTQVIVQNANAMIRYLNYILQKRNSNGTVAIGLGDWVPVGKASEEYDVPLEVTDSIMVMDMAKKASEMFAAIGYSHQADFANEVYKDFRNVIRTQLVDKNSLVVQGESQSGQAMALYYSVFEQDEEEGAFEKLMQYISENNNNFNCGFLGMHVLFHVLSKFGQADLAYEMITKKEYPSYGHLIELGETTLTEQFMPDGVYCGSHNHHFLGDISRWFITSIAGLNVINTSKVEIKPNFIKKIDYATAYYCLPTGKVEVNWTREKEKILLIVKCAKNIQCDIRIPDELKNEVIISYSTK